MDCTITQIEVFAWDSFLSPVLLKQEYAPESPGRLNKNTQCSASPTVFCFFLGWGLQSCISNKFSRMPMLLVQGSHFENHCLSLLSSKNILQRKTNFFTKMEVCTVIILLLSKEGFIMFSVHSLQSLPNYSIHSLNSLHLATGMTLISCFNP